MTLSNRSGSTAGNIDLRRMNLIVQVLGEPELNAKLRTATLRIQRQIARRAVNAGLGEIVSEIRRQIDATDMSSDAKRAMKRTVGKRIKSKQTELFGILEAKAGLGVGKRTKARRLQAEARRQAGQKKGQSKGAKKGVGLDAWNVHWFGLGTKPRRTRRGKYVGQLKAQNVVSLAYQSAGTRALDVIRRRAGELIERELNLGGGG